MSTSVLLIALSILGGSFAYPSIDWSKLKTKDLYVKKLLPAAIINQNGARIIGGEESVANSHPYMAAVIVNGDTFCGASLIASSWVLTAAHCAEGGSYASVILGAHKPFEVESTQVTVTSTNIIVHPEWSSSDLKNDLALIQLPTAIPLTSAIQPVSVASASSGSFAGSTALLTGWGFTSDDDQSLSNALREVDLRIISVDDCRESIGIWAYETVICTPGVGESHNVGACYGDSGSPLVVGDVQVGIVSFGEEKCETGGITAYTRLSSYASWIGSYVN